MRAATVALIALSRPRAIVTDRSGGLQRIRHGYGGRPARDDRRDDLHRERDQDDRKKSL
ncbi:hypothetical protein JQ543_20395 [Bradyrhizobium diazoefficiens]|nr:hypothetical protein [Bradyrhizobium diazoefficiens]MBR0850122.1 hypothetical protein [Bradyrhizobium diazoefficiens]